MQHVNPYNPQFAARFQMMRQGLMSQGLDAWTAQQKAAAKVRRAFRVGTQSGIANPAPCVDRRTITALTKDLINGPYQVAFEVLVLSDDGGFSRH